MARIIEYQQRTSAPEVSQPRQSSPGRSPSFGPALANVAEGLNSIDRAVEENAKAWSASAMADVRLKWSQRFMQKQKEAKPAAQGFTDEFLTEFDEYSSEFINDGGSVPEGHAKKFMQQRLQSFRSEMAGQALQFEAESRVNWQDDQFKQARESTKKLMNTDDGQYPIALAEQMAIVNAADVTPAHRLELQNKLIDEVSSAAVWSQIQKSPVRFLNSIGFYGVDPSTTANKKDRTRKSTGDLTGITGNMAFDALSFDKRVQMFDLAIRSKVQIEADADAARNARANYPSNQATLRKALQMTAADPVGAEQFIFGSNAKGLLNPADMKQLIGDARSTARQQGPKSEYERSRNYIIGSLDPGPMVNDPVARARVAEALDTFDRWTISGQRTDEEIIKRGREVVGQYRFINLSDTILALPSPRSGQIRRSATDTAGMLADVQAAANKAKADLATGKLTQEEYENEMEILNRWRKAASGAK